MRKESKNLCIGSNFPRCKYPHEVLGEAGGFLQIKLLESFAKVKDQKFGRSSKFLVEIHLSLRLVRRAGRAGKLCGLCDFLARWFSGVVCRFSRWYLGQAGGRLRIVLGHVTSIHFIARIIGSLNLG
jgi:hypothetical protein